MQEKPDQADLLRALQAEAARNQQGMLDEMEASIQQYTTDSLQAGCDQAVQDVFGTFEAVFAAGDQHLQNELANIVIDPPAQAGPGD